MRILQLIIPALLPSWRFFAYVGPSPRIEYALLDSLVETPTSWQEFRPRPTRVSFATMLRRLLWNPSWNESLYLVTCCERLLEGGSSVQFWQEEIFKRLSQSVSLQTSEGSRYLVFRIVLIERQGDQLTTEPAFVSARRVIPPVMT